MATYPTFRTSYLLMGGLLLLLGCTGDGDAYQPPTDALFTEVTGSGVDFVNTVVDGEDFNVLSYRNFYNGGGVAIADLNGDDRPDLYFTANQGPNRLYLNQGDWQFTEVDGAGGAAGAMFWSTGVTAVDVNADGRLDLYVCNSGEENGSRRSNELFINVGNDDAGRPSFREAAAAYGLDDRGFGTQAAWFDYDGDGDLDVYLLNNSYTDPERIDPRGGNRRQPNAEGGDKLLRNDAGPDHPVFTDVSAAAGIYSSAIGFGLGVGLGDLDGNGWTDIYVSNDFYERDYLYLNRGDGTFDEVMDERIDHTSVSSMGSDVADLDNDGDLDIFSTDMLAADHYRLQAATLFDSYTTEGIKYEADYHHQILQNCLQVNDGSGHFTETAHYSGVSATDWSWGALIFDMDNDGRKDIFVANGIYHDIMSMDFTDFINDEDNIRALVREKGRFDWRDLVEYLPENRQPNYAFLNRGQLRFENQASALGLGRPGFSNGAAYGDLDGDGDLDLVTNNVNEGAALYRSAAAGSGNASVTVRLRGEGQNPEGIGARVTVVTDEGEQIQEKYTSRGYLSSVGTDLVFGLGTATLAHIHVRWPDGREQRVTPSGGAGLITVDQSESTAPASAPVATTGDAAPLLTTAADLFASLPAHEEAFFNDFDHEGLLLSMLSDPGPGIVTGDPNGDGRTDFVLLGGLGQADRLYQQTTDGRFRPVAQDGLAQTAEFESSCGVFFDADGDGDEDLMLGAGGNDLSRGFDAYRLRYYENLSGNLIYSPVGAPRAGGEVSCLLPQDVDLDGDTDLFVGCRAIPGNYGVPPRSYLFIREDNSWVDKTPEQLTNVGMVTGGTWTDLNTDGRPDLVLVGDWMPITIAFTLGGATISDPFRVPGSSGWWTDVRAADLDGDGREDLVATNWGKNTKFRASRERPLEMYVKDFDGNKKTDFVINWYPPGAGGERLQLFAPKQKMHGQLPHLRKRSLKYDDYAKLTYETLFSEEERQGARKYVAEELRSCVIWNEGGGQVNKQPLPWQAQLALQYATAIGDVNGDGRPDLWLGGNQYQLTPQVGRADAGRGTLLLNAGDRQWTYLPPAAAGIDLRGEVRDAAFVPLADGTDALLVGCNNDALRAYRLPASTSK